MSRQASKAPDPSLRERILARLVPEEYRRLEGGSAALARTFGIAMAVRLLLMPIACHSDLISTYHRAWTMLKEFHPAHWMPHQIIEAAFLVVYSPFLRLDELLGWDRGISASVDFWLETFAPHPQVLPALFLFKLPYLLSDLGIALILLRLFADAPAKGLRAAAMWLFNPVTIFAFYVFGRHDVISIFFIALSLLALKRTKPLRGALAFGIALWSRYWPFFLLPFLLLVERGSWRKKLRIGAISLAPMLLYNLVSAVGKSSHTPPSIAMANSDFRDYLLGLNLSMGWSHVLYVLPTAYLLLVMFASLARPGENRVARFSEYAVCCLALFYATAFFHPQYFTWFILFLVILRVGERRPVLRNLHYFQILLFVPFTFYWKQTTFGFLFAPLDPEFFIAMKPPADWVAPIIDPLLLVNLAHTGISATCLFMAGWILLGGRARDAEAD